MSITTDYFRKLPENFQISLSTDIGNDPDDGLALLQILQAMEQNLLPKKSLKDVTTTLYNPVEKAVIAARICKFMKNNQVAIKIGYGCTPQLLANEKSHQEKAFLDAYPFWPIDWGIPGVTNAVSMGQGKAFKDMDFDPEQIIFKNESSEGEQILLGLAPYTDLVKSMETPKKINRIILMGGYFGKEADGKIEITRPGYNTAIDPVASEKLITQKQHPVLIFNSQHIFGWDFSWKQEELLAIICSGEKNQLGVAIAKDFAHYWSNKKPTPFGSLIMADVLTTYVGLIKPQLIKSTMPVEFSFNSKTYMNPITQTEEPIHMMHPQAKTLFSVKKVEHSNVHIVTELAIDPKILRTQIVEGIAADFFFSSKESFRAAVEAQKEKPLSNDQIRSQLASLYVAEGAKL